MNNIGKLAKSFQLTIDKKRNVRVLAQFNNFFHNFPRFPKREQSTISCRKCNGLETNSHTTPASFREKGRPGGLPLGESIRLVECTRSLALARPIADINDNFPSPIFLIAFHGISATTTSVAHHRFRIDFFFRLLPPPPRGVSSRIIPFPSTLLLRFPLSLQLSSDYILFFFRSRIQFDSIFRAELIWRERELVKVRYGMVCWFRTVDLEFCLLDYNYRSTPFSPRLCARDRFSFKLNKLVDRAVLRLIPFFGEIVFFFLFFEGE